MPQTTDDPILDERFRAAMGLAAVLHHRQVRKGTKIPYLAHLLQVAATVLEHGGDGDEAAAALLHDAAEDQGGEATLRRIEEACGARVAAIVRECSDSLAEDDSKKDPWRVRKERYLAHLASASASARLVSAADKLHNCRATARGWRREGEEFWRRFNAGRGEQLWYQRAVVERLRASDPAPNLAELIEELDDAVLDLEMLAMCGSLSQALAIAARVHSRQRDKAGAEYVHHPLRVMARVETDAERIAAVLHDVVEDSPGWTPARLAREGFSDEVVGAVEALTKREGEDYADFVRRAGANPVARRVKLADLEDNMDVRRLGTLTDKDLERLRKYHAARRELIS
jgi:(p)ppGpp synthase/HD superfamily hydrolase